MFDLDGTLTVDAPGEPYADRKPRAKIRELLVKFREQGFSIIISSSRNMKTHGNSVGVINAKTLPVMFEWLDRHGIPYDEIHIGKPWCGDDGFYVDDKAIRPSELQALSYAEIQALLARETALAREE